MHQLVKVRPEPPGQYTAHVVGLPEIQATAATREEAIQQVRHVLSEWLASGQLVSVEIPQENPLLKWFGHADPNDPLEKEYLEDLARFRQEDLERTLREYEEEDRRCSDSSSTPTT
jgi:predicted RNase H-like HicB family nuclease